MSKSPEIANAAPPIHVMAGVVTDVRGRVLLARRTQGRDLAGLWEFPGGKVDPGETPEQALARELHEELGIDADIGAPLISVPQQMPHKRIVLDVRHVPAHRGQLAPIDLLQKISLIQDHWQPHVVAEMNDYQFKISKLQGEFVWHSHADTDETDHAGMAHGSSSRGGLRGPFP